MHRVQLTSTETSKTGKKNCAQQCTKCTKMHKNNKIAKKTNFFVSQLQKKPCVQWRCTMQKLNKRIQAIIKNKKLLETILELQGKISYELDFYLKQPENKKYSVEIIYGILLGVSEDVSKINEIITEKIEKELDILQINV